MKQVEMEDKKISAIDIYAEMLEFGSNHLNLGITLIEVRNHLRSKNLYQEGYDEFIRQCFSWSFSHKELGCNCELRPGNECGCDKDDPCNDFDHEEHCKHYMNKEACLDLLTLTESQNNRETVKWSKRNGNIAIWIAVLSLLLSVLSPIFFDKIYHSEQDKNIKKISDFSQRDVQIADSVKNILLRQYEISKVISQLDSINKKTVEGRKK